MRITRLEERVIRSLCYVFFDLLRLRLCSFLFRELLLLLLSLLSLLGGSLLGGHDNRQISGGW
jgi:hypothetical protein